MSEHEMEYHIIGKTVSWYCEECGRHIGFNPLERGIGIGGGTIHLYKYGAIKVSIRLSAA